MQYAIYSADGNDIREKADQDELDFGVLVKPVESPNMIFSVCPVGKPGVY